MCGRYTLRTDGKSLAKTFKVNPAAQPRLIPRYNVAPSQPVPVIRSTHSRSESLAEPAQRAEGSQTADKSGHESSRDDNDGTDPGREMALLRWGLVPAWADDPAIGNRMVNARAEGITDKPAYRAAMKYRRCLIPADGFYEWKVLDNPEAKPDHAQAKGRRKPTKPLKQPYLLELADGKPFAFAGLWEHWQDAAGNELESCTIITSQPNELLATMHTRMPVILKPEHFADWLDPSAQSSEQVRELAQLLRPYSAQAMRAVAVSRRVNKPANDDPRCVEPLEPTDLADRRAEADQPASPEQPDSADRRGAKPEAQPPDHQQALFNEDTPTDA